MSANRGDVWKLLGYVEADLRGAQAKLTELRSMLAGGAMDRAPAEERKCRCGVVVATDRELLEHRYSVHDEGEVCLGCGRVREPGHACGRETAPPADPSFP